MRRLALLTALAVGGLMAVGVPASQAEPFDCTNATVFVAQEQPTQLNALEYGAGSTSFVPIGAPHSEDYNALGFNPVDNFLYAIENTGPDEGQLLRIHSDGTAEELGAIVGGPTGANVGTFDDAGNYYITSSAPGDTQLFQVNVTTQIATPIALSEPGLVSDVTYADGFLWGIRNDLTDPPGGDLVRIDPVTGQVDTFPQTAVPAPYIYGANWTYGNGNLGFSNNDTGAVYQVAISDPAGTPTLSLVSSVSGPDSSNNDGAWCGMPVDLEVEKAARAIVAPGGQVTWRITVTNNGPGGSSGFTLNDTLPAEVSNVQTSTPGCTITGQDLQCVLGALAVGESTQIVVTGTAPDRPRVCFRNLANVLGNELDPVPENNTDRARTCTGEPRLVIKKRAGKNKVRPGGVVPYKIVVRNKGKGVAKPVRVCDRLPKGMRLVRAPGATKTTARRACWRFPRLNPGKKRTFRVIAQVKNGTRPGKLRNTATVTGCQGSKRCKDKDPEDVTVVPPVSICVSWRVSASC